MQSTIEERIKAFINDVSAIEIRQEANIQKKHQLEKSIQRLLEDNKILMEQIDLYQNAIVILREVSDETVRKSYEFITENINNALERIFEKSQRKIRLHEYTRAGQYPQLEIILTVEGGKTRSLKSDSGHGLMQIVSLLFILCLIVITGSRRLLIIDEVLSGLSDRSREIISEIFWTFTQIGFQFIISEHGFIPKGAKVYHLQMDGGVSRVVNEYIEQDGVYLGTNASSTRQSRDVHVAVIGEEADEETKQVIQQTLQNIAQGKLDATANNENAIEVNNNQNNSQQTDIELKSGNVIQI